MPFNNTAQHVMLDALDESATQITHFGLHTLTDPGQGTTANAGEATGGTPAYARTAAVFSAAAAGEKVNTSTHAFNAPAGTYGFITFWNASTGNTTNYRGYSHLNNTKRGVGTVDAAGVTSNTITSAGHGMVNTRQCMVYNVFAESLPTGLVEGTIYFVVGATTDTFQLSLTSGGAAVDITAIGELAFFDLIPETFGVDGTLNLAAGAVVLSLVTI